MGVEGNGELGWEFTRRINSDIGVDFVRVIEYALVGILEDVAEVGAGLVRYERSVGGRRFSWYNVSV